MNDNVVCLPKRQNGEMMCNVTNGEGDRQHPMSNLCQHGTEVPAKNERNSCLPLAFNLATRLTKGDWCELRVSTI